MKKLLLPLLCVMLMHIAQVEAMERSEANEGNQDQRSRCRHFYDYMQLACLGVMVRLGLVSGYRSPGYGQRLTKWDRVADPVPHEEQEE